MVAAAAAKGIGVTNSDSAAITPETPVVDPTATQDDAAQVDATVTEGDDAQAGQDEHSYSLEEDGFVGAKDLAAKIDANEALKAALPADMRNELMANARLAQEAAAFRQIFSSPDEAKVISDSAREFAGFQEAFVSVTPDNIPQGTTNLIQMMLQASVRRDEDGNPIMEDGKPVTDNTVGRFLTESSKRWVDHNIIKKVESLKDDSVTAALDLVMESVGLRPSTAAQDQVDPAIAVEREALARERAEIHAQRQAAQQEATKSYKTTLNTQLGEVWDGEMGKLLTAATGLSEFDREAVSQRIDAAMRKEINNSTAYKRQKDLLELRPMGDKRRAEEISLARSFLRTNLVRVAKPFLEKAGVSVKGKADARQEAQAAREQASRGEVKAGSAIQTRNVTTPQTPAQQRAVVSQALQTKLGREPNDSEINTELMMLAYERRKTA